MQRQRSTEQMDASWVDVGFHGVDPEEKGKRVQKIVGRKK